MKPPYPIVLINFGQNPYMPYVLVQAKRANPETTIVFLSDVPPLEGLSFIDTVPIQDFYHSSNALQSSYRHFSVNSPFNEFVCLARWLVIRDFMRTTGHEGFFHIDSDVLLFDDMSRTFPALTTLGLVTSGISAHTSFLSLGALDELCRLIEGYYFRTEPEIVRSLEAEMAEHAPNGPCPSFNISDMNFLEYQRRNTRMSRGEISAIHGTPFGERYLDHNINVSERIFRMRDGKKSIEWDRGVPYCRLDGSEERVRFASLHYQGHAKSMIPVHFDAVSTGLSDPDGPG